uniref:Uncharacterized protein n=1 Tax=Geospiza parvula TaxID=87175 RepID=A0A8C3MIT9_GEOPR
MDDDDDESCLLDLIGDPQALNYFLHGPSSKSSNEDLTNAEYSVANSNSIFANSNNTDPKSSVKGVSGQLGEGPSDGLQLSSSLQFLEDELVSSPLPDLTEDQPFDILQKSLQEANITEQTLAEEAYLDASVGSSQQFAQAQLHPSSSASFTQASNVSNYSGQTLQPIGVTQVVQQPVGASFASNTVGVQHGFMQHVGISVPGQHLSNSSQISGSGQIQLIGSFSNQPSMMTINNLDGSQIILKGNGQQTPANMSSGLLVHRQTPNGNSLFSNSNSSPVAQPVTVPFNSTNFQTSLPVHNIIIQRGLAPNSNKVPINIQPKPIQMGQQTAYNVNNLGIQQHHVQQGIPFASANSPQSSVVGPHMSVNIVNQQQNTRKSVTPQTASNAGGSIVIHSPMGQPHAPQNQFLIPTSLSVNSNSVHHVQAINGQLLQTQPSQLVPGQVSAEHVMLNRNSTNMLRANQSYSGQMLNNQNTAVQLVSGQTFTAPGNQVIVNHGTSQIVGGQVPLQQASPTVLHLSPSQANVSQGRSSFTTMSPGQSTASSMSASSRFAAASSSGSVHPSLGASVQSVASGGNFTGDQLGQSRAQVAVSASHRLPASSSKSVSTFSHTSVGVTQQQFAFGQKKAVNQTSPVSASKTQDNLRQPQLTNLLSNTLSGQDSGGKIIQQSLGTAQPQEKVIGSSSVQQSIQVDGHLVGQKRPAAKQLTKGAFILQQLQKDQVHAVTPDKSRFRSLNDAVQRLLSYHVCQGSLPTEEDLRKVDSEFESVATQLLKRTQAMLNKYRCLLIEDAMRINPSAEMVMIDRMFNQEERASLTREKRLALVDPDGYQADFCCSAKQFEKTAEEAQSSKSDHQSSKTLSSRSQPTKTQARDRPKSSSAESTNHSKLPIVPNNILTQEGKASTKKSESLTKALKFEKANCSSESQYVALSEERMSGKDLAKSTENSSSSEDLSKIVSRGSHGTHNKISRNAVQSFSKVTCNNSLQDKTLRSSPKNEVLHPDHRKSSGEPQEDLLLSKSLETTFKNILELKKAGRQPQNEAASSGSVELEFPNFSPIASQENCLEKFIPDHSESVVETDSILEAAVNSILEC